MKGHYLFSIATSTRQSVRGLENTESKFII